MATWRRAYNVLLFDDVSQMIDRTYMELRLDKIKQRLIRKAEKDFEQMLQVYPYFVDLPTISNNFNQGKSIVEYCDFIVAYLSTNFSEGSYVVFPPDAMGKYKSKANGVLFKSKDDALLFKLSI